ncbi:MAG TPA: histidine phosphatase family protein, partial [Burkholderiaceae bacterium]|nr:histidine phosphatase family protein [Burkholderiaceae bacterium]
RHAKSSKDDPTLVDRDRPLADRGRKEAPKMGKRLAKRDVKPDLLVSSPALRALETAHLIADAIGCERKDIVVDDRLYASSADGLLAVIHGLDKKVDRVMLFGHNPEFTELAHRLSSDIVDMPTCAIAEFRFDTKKWSDVGELEPEQATLDHPLK